jgi:hypothetical protein
MNNYVQYNIFGNYKIEGIQSVYDLYISGPILITGNKSVFETSILAVLYCVVVGSYLLMEEYKKGTS